MAVLTAILIPTIGCAGPPTVDEVLERARSALGTPAIVAAAGGLAFRAEGLQYRGAEHQGRAPDSRDPGEYEERIAYLPPDETGVDAADPVTEIGGEDLPRVAWEYRHRRDDGTSEWIREIYDEPRSKTLVVFEQDFAISLRSDEHLEARHRVARRLPVALLAELGRGLTPEDLEVTETAYSLHTTLDGREAVVDLDPSSGVIRRVLYRMDVPTFGDTEIVWAFADYRPVEGLGLFPRTYTVSIQDRLWLEMEVTEVALGESAAASLLTLPEEIESPRVVELPADSDASRNATVEALADGVWRVRNLRTGFHPWFLEMEEGVVAVDAPAGYPLLAELPAGDVAPGPSSAWLSERFLELIRETVPDKPVTDVIVTHFHNDHAGGLRAFVTEGARIHAPASEVDAIRDWLEAPHTLAPDRLAEEPRPPRIVAVKESAILDDGAREVEILDVGDNPHTDHMLVVHLPEESILFVSDLFMPVPLEAFPTPSYDRVDRAFATWLAERGLEPERIYSMHAGMVGTAEHLRALSPGGEESTTGS